VCADWLVLGPSPEVPSNTEVPTLVLQGEFDPNSRPDDSRRVVDRLGSNARRIDFVGIGHSVWHYSPCAEAVVAAFIGSPDQRLDAACTSMRPEIAYRAFRCPLTSANHPLRKE
jgi:alpha-beta hydrolase superfamily lysophospholipase